ncbi:hypothetical protein B6K86_03305 [Lachnospiraceae bacterium]|nr:hypothetical protein B6K86_03305 [Lachnospiraceae bacterium]
MLRLPFLSRLGVAVGAAGHPAHSRRNAGKAADERTADERTADEGSTDERSTGIQGDFGWNSF